MNKIVAALGFLVLCASAQAGAGEVRPIVVEVYTSQGCNTCLPANILAAKASA